MPSAPNTVLVVSNDPPLREAVVQLLVKQGHAAIAVDTGARALEELGKAELDIVVSHVEKDATPDWLLSLRDRPEQERVLLADTTSVPVDLLRGGAVEVVSLPLQIDELTAAIYRCSARLRARNELARAEGVASLSQTLSLHLRCLQLLANPDLEWTQERVLAELTSSANAQSAALYVSAERDELLLKAFRGLVDKHSLPDRYDTRGALGATARAGRPFAGTDVRGGRALWVPLVSQGELLGLVQLSDPLSGAFTPEVEQEVAVLADFAASALRIGRRLLALQRLGFKDRETGAYNLSYFTDYASKEIYKARRYARSFSLLICSMDHLSHVRLRLGPDEARRAARGVSRAIASLARDSDIVAKASEHEFYLLLPETDALGAASFLRRAMASAHADSDVREIETRLTLGLVAAAATYPRDGQDFDELLYRCQRRMAERRTSLCQTLPLETLGFWEQVELLVGSPQSPKLPFSPNAAPSRRGKVAEGLFEELQGEVAREILRDPNTRGLCYIGAGIVRRDLPMATTLESAPVDLVPRVYILGKRANLHTHVAITPVFLDGDERLSRHQFLLWRGEQAAYALLQRPGRGMAWGFHSSDTAVVEDLIAKLQAEYDLQAY